MQSVKSKNSRYDDTLNKNGKSVRSFEKIYRPTDKEPFMNERQREYFRMKLLDWREAILKEAKETLQHLQDDNQNHPDLADRASSETDRAIELRARDRQRKLIAKIDAALQRIEDGTYGYCEETGEPISLKRLEARPIATLSIEAQERHERRGTKPSSPQHGCPPGNHVAEGDFVSGETQKRKVCFQAGRLFRGWARLCCGRI